MIKSKIRSVDSSVAVAEPKPWISGLALQLVKNEFERQIENQVFMEALGEELYESYGGSAHNVRCGVKALEEPIMETRTIRYIDTLSGFKERTITTVVTQVYDPLDQAQLIGLNNKAQKRINTAHGTGAFATYFAERRRF
jgi:hypothetical protein